MCTKIGRIPDLMPDMKIDQMPRTNIKAPEHVAQFICPQEEFLLPWIPFIIVTTSPEIVKRGLHK